MKREPLLTIGALAERSGVSASALRFYEERGLINSVRTSGNQRRYPRSMLRRVSVILVAKTLGLTLEEIVQAMATLPNARTPTKKDWDGLANLWRDQLDERIRLLQELREKLSGCIGCGCLSLKRCTLYNEDDRAGARGSGPRYLLGDTPDAT